MIITNKTEYEKADFCLGEAPTFDHAKIVSTSDNNKIYCEHGVTLHNSTITFVGDGNVIYLSRNYYSYSLDLRIYKNSCFYMDENNCLGGQISVLVQEHQNILIGKDVFLSYGIHLMTSDAHLIYGVKDKKRLNFSKSILIGDHVWIGQYTSVFKGTTIGSGSIIGGTSTITGKNCPSNTIWAGNPAKMIKKDIFWETSCTNLFDADQTEKNERCERKSHCYTSDGKQLDFITIDTKLKECKDNTFARLQLLGELREIKDKNRFYLAEETK